MYVGLRALYLKEKSEKRKSPLNVEARSPGPLTLLSIRTDLHCVSIYPSKKKDAVYCDGLSDTQPLGNIR